MSEGLICNLNNVDQTLTHMIPEVRLLFAAISGALKEGENEENGCDTDN